MSKVLLLALSAGTIAAGAFAMYPSDANPLRLAARQVIPSAHACIPTSLSGLSPETTSAAPGTDPSVWGLPSTGSAAIGSGNIATPSASSLSAINAFITESLAAVATGTASASPVTAAPSAASAVIAMATAESSGGGSGGGGSGGGGSGGGGSGGGGSAGGGSAAGSVSSGLYLDPDNAFTALKPAAVILAAAGPATDALQRLLEEAGYDVRVTSAMESAIDLVQSVEPEVILVDRQFGRAVERVRGALAGTYTPVALKSGNPAFQVLASKSANVGRLANALNRQASKVPSMAAR